MQNPAGYILNDPDEDDVTEDGPLVVVISSVLLFAIVSHAFAGFYNRGIFSMASLVLPLEGGLYDNTWIGGIVEPFITKLFPLIILGLLGPVKGVIKVGAGFFVVGVPLLLLEQMGYTVSATTQFFLLFLYVAIILIAHYYRHGDTLAFPSEFVARPWISGALFGFSVGAIEMYWYISNRGIELLPRVPPLLMHTLLGSLICGTWIILNEREESLRNNLVGWASVSIAIVFHVWFNTWLVSQEWYQNIVGL